MSKKTMVSSGIHKIEFALGADSNLTLIVLRNLKLTGLDIIKSILTSLVLPKSKNLEPSNE